MLTQFESCFKADGVDDEMGMDVRVIAVCRYQHLIPWPCLRRKLQCDLMGLLVCDAFFWREGLHILVEADAFILVPCCLGCFKLCNGIESVTVNATDPSLTCFFIPGFLFLHAVIHDPLHITGPLPGFFDISDGRQSITPANAPDFLVDGSLQVDDLLEVVGAENTGVDLSGDLVQIVADTL